MKKIQIPKSVILIGIGISLLLMLASQISHSVAVYNLIAQGESEVYSYSFAISFDISVAVFILLGKKFWAYGSAVFMFIMNLIYYAKPLQLSPLLMLIVAAVTVSVIMAAIISSYSILMHDEQITPEPKAAKNPVGRPRKNINIKIAG